MTEVCANPDRKPNAGFLQLRIWSEMFEDAQKARIACTNRAERAGVDADLYSAQLDAMKRAEHEIALAMRRHYRSFVPEAIRAWQVETPGIGEHLLSRLLGALGHPRIAQPWAWVGEGESRELVPLEPYERSVSQLWSYCGHGDATRKRKVGMSQDDAFALGNPRCKMLVRLLAEACMKTGRATVDPEPEAEAPDLNPSPAAAVPPNSEVPPRLASPYRAVYDEGRERYAEREGWTPGHQHAAALRLAGKALLKDLWIAGHGDGETHTAVAGRSRGLVA